MKGVRVVEQSADVLAFCAAPSSGPARGFPEAKVDRKLSDAAAPRPAVISVRPGAPMTEEAEAAQREAERLWGAMSMGEKEAALREVQQELSPAALEILQRRAARRHQLSEPTSASSSKEQPTHPPEEDQSLHPRERELLLPPIESDKLAWTDPDAPQQPRERNHDMATSLRVRAFRFGLQGEIMTAESAGPDTYNAGLHHHGEEHDKPGYSLEELMILMRSVNEPQNVFAVQTFAKILGQILAPEGPFSTKLLYPEAGPRSMTIGEGILWEILVMQMLIAFRLLFGKRSPALREICWSALNLLCQALARDHIVLNNHAGKVHWGQVMFPHAPLFEDDGSDEMEKLDGLRVMVRQLDFLALLDARQPQSLDIMYWIASHSAGLAILVAHHENGKLIRELVSAHLDEANSAHREKALRVLRIVLSADCRLLQMVDEFVLLVPRLISGFLSASVPISLESALVLRVFLLYGHHVANVAEALPQVLSMLSSGSISVHSVCIVVESLVVQLPDSSLAQVGSLLEPLVKACANQADRSAVLHFAATWVRRTSEKVRPIVAPLFAGAEKDEERMYALLRLANADRVEGIAAGLPDWFWSDEKLALTLSVAQMRTDLRNRFKTQRRTRTLVSERGRILLLRELLIAGCLRFRDPLAAFGKACDLVAHLALVGADEPLALEFFEKVLVNPQFLERVARGVFNQTQAAKGSYDSSDSLHQTRLICEHAMSGIVEEFFPQSVDWMQRCRIVCCDLATNAGALDNLFAARPDAPCMATFLGADWLFCLLRSKRVTVARAAIQMLTLAESTGVVPSLLKMAPISKLIKVCSLFTGGSETFLDPAVGAALEALLQMYSEGMTADSFSHGSALEEEDADQFNPMQCATDLVEAYLASGSRSAVFAQYVFFFMRADLPFDFRMLTWTSLAPVWRLLQIDDKKTDISHHMHPLETNRKVIGLMETALTSGRLTPASNACLFGIAVHHVAGFVFNDAMEEWPRMQVLERLQNSRNSDAMLAILEKGGSAPILKKMNAKLK